MISVLKANSESLSKVNHSSSVNDNSWYPSASKLKYHHQRFLKREKLSVVEIESEITCLSMSLTVNTSLF